MSYSEFVFNDFEKEEQIIFREFLNFIIPPGTDGRMPGACCLIDQYELTYSVFFLKLSKEIKQIIETSCSLYKKKFTGLNSAEISFIFNDFKIKNSGMFNQLATEIIQYYYTNIEVLKAIGVLSIPPFPDGNLVEEVDLLLLEQVFLKGRIYR